MDITSSRHHHCCRIVSSFQQNQLNWNIEYRHLRVHFTSMKCTSLEYIILVLVESPEFRIHINRIHSEINLKCLVFIRSVAAATAVPSLYPALSKYLYLRQTVVSRIQSNRIERIVRFQNYKRKMFVYYSLINTIDVSNGL